MNAPLVIMAALGALLLTRRRASNDSPPATASVPVTGWNPAWGTPNDWDARYPGSDPSRPIPYDAANLDPVLRDKVAAIFLELEQLGYDPRVFEGARTQHRQAWLYGSSRLDFPVYGRAGRWLTGTLSASNHGANPVRAVDIISRSRGWEWPEFYVALGAAAKRQGLTWGGDWPKRDSVHVELKSGQGMGGGLRVTR